MKFTKNILQHTIHYLLVALFVCYYGNSTLFYHSHKVNGQVIAHSHVHQGEKTDSDSEHSHSPQELLCIHIVKHSAYYNNLAAPDMLQVNLPFLTISYCSSKHQHALKAYVDIPARAPPCI